MADRFLDFPVGSFGAGVAFWREVTGSTLSPFRGATGEFATLLPPSGDAFLRVQRVAVPGPVQLDDAGASRADELCLDIPAGTFERERSFWTALTGWEGQDGARSVRLGFQPCDDAGPVTGRLGFGCDDRRALAGRHAAAGARILAVLPHETAMADPVGRSYRLTGE